MNTPLTGNAVEKLGKGFHPTLFPNRRQRRAFKQKINNRPNMSAIKYVQTLFCKNTERIKKIYHYKEVVGFNNPGLDNNPNG